MFHWYEGRSEDLGESPICLMADAILGEMAKVAEGYPQTAYAPTKMAIRIALSGLPFLIRAVMVERKQWSNS